MEINQKSSIKTSFLSSQTSMTQAGETVNSFANCLSEQIAKTAETSGDEGSNLFAGDFAAIEKKGFSAYVRDLEKEKIEKIRKDILERMGLTEADLAKLPPKQRAMIEDMIAQEIKNRLAASSMKNNDEQDKTGQSSDRAMIGIRPDLAFLSMMGDQGKNDSFAVTEKEENGQ